MSSCDIPHSSGERPDLDVWESGLRTSAASAPEDPDVLLLADVVPHIDVVVWRFWPDGRREVYGDRMFEVIWGRSRDEMRDEGTTFLDTVHPEERMRLSSLCDASHRGERQDEVFRVVHPDGTVRWARFRTFPVRRDDGSLHYTVGIAGDVTERETMRLDLEERSRQLMVARNRIARLLRATITVHEASEEQDVLEHVAEAVYDTGWGRVAVSLLDRSWEVKQQAFRGLSKREIEFVQQNRPDPAARRRMFSRECEPYRVGRSYFIPGDDLERERSRWRFLLTSSRHVEVKQEWDPRNLLYVPLTGHDGRILGYISMDDPAEGRRELDDTFRYLDSFADLAASVIEGIRLRRAEDAREEELHRVMREQDHRIRNALASIGQLAEMSGRLSPDMDSFLSSFAHRVSAFAEMNSLLMRNAWARTVPLLELVHTALGPYMAPGRVDLNGEPCRIPGRVCRALSMTLAELAMNAAKYGSLSCKSGVVSIAWTLSDDPDPILELVWQESGGPEVHEPTREGVGTVIIRDAIEHELHGSLEWRFDPAGLICRMHMNCAAD